MVVVAVLVVTSLLKWIYTDWKDEKDEVYLNLPE